MTRRTFLKSLGVASAGVAAGLSMLPRVKGDKVPTGMWDGIMSMDEFYRQNPNFHLVPNCGVMLLRWPEDPEYRHIRIKPSPSKFHLIDGEWRRAEWA